MKNLNLQIGAILIVAGTSIGAAILALPISSYSMGFLPSTALMITMWAVALFSSLIIAKINVYFGKSISIPLAAEKILGKKAEILASAAMLILLYALLVAYISGGAAILHKELGSMLNVKLYKPILAILLTVIFGSLVSYKLKAVDYSNRIMFVAKLMIFTVITIFIVDDVKIDHLSYVGNDNNLLPAILVFFTSFGFQLSIHAIVRYVGTDYITLRRVFILGTLIPLAIYILWQLIVLGVLPIDGANSFSIVNKAGGDLGVFVKALGERAGKVKLSPLISWFSLLAILTSLLGVAIGLFEYFMELFKYKHNNVGKFKSGLCTFALPLLFVLIYPEMFIESLTVAAAFLSLVAVVIPAMIVLKLYKIDRKKYKELFGSRIPIVIMLLIGVSIIVIKLYSL